MGITWQLVNDPELAIVLHVESVNIIAKNRLTLKKWESALTILLEKVMGNQLIKKLEAICLLILEEGG